MGVAFQIASIFLAVLLIVLIMLQVRGGALGSVFGGDAGGGIVRTRRGLERLLFRVTVGISIVFLAICIFATVTYT